MRSTLAFGWLILSTAERPAATWRGQENGRLLWLERYCNAASVQSQHKLPDPSNRVLL